MDEVDGVAAWQMSVWMTKHGKVLKPKLTNEHHRQLKQCFKLMDEDGSGAVSADELEIAFKLLAVKASRRQIEAVLVAAGAADESGEIGYDAYVQAMSTQLFTGLSRKKKVAGDSANSEGGLLSFDTQVNKYKRKKLIQALHDKDTEAVKMLKATPRKAETGSGGQPAVSVLHTNTGQGSSMRPMSASSALVEAAVAECTAVFADILPPVKESNVHRSNRYRPISRQIPSPVSSKRPVLLSSRTAQPSSKTTVECMPALGKQHCKIDQMAVSSYGVSSPGHQSAGYQSAGHQSAGHQSAGHQSAGHAQQVVEPHLAALHQLGCQDHLLQPIPVQSSQHTGNKPYRLSDSKTPERGTKAHPNVAWHAKPASRTGCKLPAVQIRFAKKQAVDMFGLGLNDNLQGKAAGLTIPRPVSSLWYTSGNRALWDAADNVGVFLWLLQVTNRSV